MLLVVETMINIEQCYSDFYQAAMIKRQTVQKIPTVRKKISNYEDPRECGQSMRKYISGEMAYKITDEEWAKLEKFLLSNWNSVYRHKNGL